MEATTDQALLGVAASPKPDELRQARNRTAALAVELSNAHDTIRDRDRQIEELGADIDAQADVNRELYTQQTAARAEAKRLRLKITKLNLEIGRNHEAPRTSIKTFLGKRAGWKLLNAISDCRKTDESADSMRGVNQLEGWGLTNSRTPVGYGRVLSPILTATDDLVLFGADLD